jgi:predicted DCC family thiol-disulfide oxidoreductase YuxK
MCGYRSLRKTGKKKIVVLAKSDNDLIHLLTFERHSTPTKTVSNPTFTKMLAHFKPVSSDRHQLSVATTIIKSKEDEQAKIAEATRARLENKDDDDVEDVDDVSEQQPPRTYVDETAVLYIPTYVRRSWRTYKIAEATRARLENKDDDDDVEDVDDVSEQQPPMTYVDETAVLSIPTYVRRSWRCGPKKDRTIPT